MSPCTYSYTYSYPKHFFPSQVTSCTDGYCYAGYEYGETMPRLFHRLEHREQPVGRVDGKIGPLEALCIPSDDPRASSRTGGLVNHGVLEVGEPEIPCARQDGLRHRCDLAQGETGREMTLGSPRRSRARTAYPTLSSHCSSPRARRTPPGVPGGSCPEGCSVR